MSRRKAAEKDDKVFKALANPVRRSMLDLLRDSAATTGEVCDHFKHLDRCTVMQHLRVLEQADLIIPKKDGRMRWNYLNVEPIQRIYNRWIKDYAAASATFLTNLKDALENS